MKSNLLKWIAVALIFAVALFFGLKTPITGEAQLIGKIFLLLCLCYLIIQTLGGVFLVTSKKMPFLFFLKNLMVFIVCSTVAVSLVNIPFDMVMSSLTEREIPNSGCSIIALTLLMMVVFFKNKAHMFIEYK